MPNWIQVQVFLSGPRDEVARFRRTCLRQIAGANDGEIGFDFESLIPMPDNVLASVEGACDEGARISPQGSRRMPLWWEWSVSNWGVKWNASDYAEIESALDDLAFSFDVPWSFPHPILKALAEQFPLLTGGASGMGWEDQWVLLGSLSNGSFSAITSDMTRETTFLVDTMLSPTLRQATTQAVSELIELQGNCAKEPTKDALQLLADDAFWSKASGHLERHVVESLKGALLDGGLDWTTLKQVSADQLRSRVCAHLAPETATRLAFAFDVERYCDWHDEDGSYIEDDGLSLDEVVRSSETLRFISNNGRSYYEIDRRLLAVLAQDLKAGVETMKTESELDEGFRRDVAHMLINISEDELLEWAGHAMFRSAQLNLADLSTMQTSFVDYASRLRREVLQFLAADDGQSQVAA